MPGVLGRARYRNQMIDVQGMVFDVSQDSSAYFHRKPQRCWLGLRLGFHFAQDGYCQLVFRRLVGIFHDAGGLNLQRAVWSKPHRKWKPGRVKLCSTALNEPIKPGVPAVDYSGYKHDTPGQCSTLQTAIATLRPWNPLITTRRAALVKGVLTGKLPRKFLRRTTPLKSSRSRRPAAPITRLSKLCGLARCSIAKNLKSAQATGLVGSKRIARKFLLSRSGAG